MFLMFLSLVIEYLVFHSLMLENLCGVPIHWNRGGDTTVL